MLLILKNKKTNNNTNLVFIEGFLYSDFCVRWMLIWTVWNCLFQHPVIKLKKNHFVGKNNDSCINLAYDMITSIVTQQCLKVFMANGMLNCMFLFRYFHLVKTSTFFYHTFKNTITPLAVNRIHLFKTTK